MVIRDLCVGCSRVKPVKGLRCRPCSKVTRRKCECGNPLAPSKHRIQQCARCRDLDGSTSATINVIQAFRTLGGFASYEALEVETGLSAVRIRSIIRRLGREGRITSVTPDGDRIPYGPTCGASQITYYLREGK